MPKYYVQFTNFEQFWIAEIVLHQSYLRHFCIRHCLRVAHSIWNFAYFYITPKENIVFEVHLFCGNILSLYCEREYTWNTLFPFGIMPIFQYFQMDFATSKQRFRKKWLKSLQCRIISAFQNCSKFVNRTFFGKRFIVLNNPTVDFSPLGIQIWFPLYALFYDFSPQYRNRIWTK